MDAEVSAQLALRLSIALLREFEHICWEYSVHMPRYPVFLKRLTRRWGEFDPLTETIAIDLGMALGNPWSVVTQVLRHEMAHALVHFEGSLEASEGPPHGPKFQRAALRLGAARWARAATCDLEEALAEGLTTGPSSKQSVHPIVRKVEGLLALSRSGDEAEALLAMEKIQRLLANHRLDTSILHKESYAGFDHGYEAKFISHRKGRLEAYQEALASVIGQHYFVRVLFTSEYLQLLDKRVKGFEFMGLEHHVQIAEYVYWFVIGRLESLWAERVKMHGKGSSGPATGRLKRSFFHGVVAGFNAKLSVFKERSEAPVHAKAASKQLALVERALDQFVAYRHPRIRNTSQSHTRVVAEAFEQGIQEGHRLQIREGIQNGSNSSSFGGYFGSGESS